MKKIINGKMYNTETAKEIGSWNNGRYRSDFYYVGETLYKKKTGELFVLEKVGLHHVMQKDAVETLLVLEKILFHCHRRMRKNG